MGMYINPPDCSKERWLQDHGEPLTVEDVKGWPWHNDKLPVCLVDNGAFTAAGIAYCQAEAEAFLEPDGRAKWWFAVSKEDLKPYMGD